MKYIITDLYRFEKEIDQYIEERLLAETPDLTIKQLSIILTSVHHYIFQELKKRGQDD